MKISKEMMDCSQKYTPIKTIGDDFKAKGATVWFGNAFKKIASMLETNEDVLIAFNATNCDILNGTRVLKILCNVAIAITDSRMIICGYNVGNINNINPYTLVHISYPINKLKKSFFKMYDGYDRGTTDLYFGKEIMLRISYPVKNKAHELFQTLIVSLQKILNIEIKDIKEKRNGIMERIKDIEPFQVALLFIVVCIAIIIYTIISALNNSTSVWDKEYDTCIICGGEMQCGICGASGVYCENAQYGAGNAHYCSEHWADCCEWHEEQKNKR